MDTFEALALCILFAVPIFAVGVLVLAAGVVAAVLYALLWMASACATLVARRRGTGDHRGL